MRQGMRHGMRQGMRMVVRPGTFFNQLQWSQHHWWILFAFLLIAAIETHVGRHHMLLATYSTVLAQSFGVPYDFALWLALSAKLFLMLFGAFFAGHVIWFVGNFFGEKNSKRVLFRRLAVVFTVVLAAYTASHLTVHYAWMATASQFLYLWGGLLGFIAIREQFFLNIPETAVVGTLAAMIVMGLWMFSNRTLENVAHDHMKSLAKVPAKTQMVRPRF
jgi:hypothetical protein